MSDVPTQSTGAPSSSQGKPAYVNTRDLEDIDRELEAYLEEKRSGKSARFNHSVDDQLSALREKFGARATPTKESLKPNEVEVIKESPRDGATEEARASGGAVPQGPVGTPQQNNAPREPQTGATFSHEDLIRSLEEKYSKGESTNLPPQKTETPLSPQSSEAAPEPAKDSKLQDFKESIEPLNASRVEGLLRSATALDPYAQETLIETFLPRFKRNKERKELYEKTQTELEDELERFIENNTGAKPGKADLPPSPEPAAETKEKAPPSPKPAPPNVPERQAPEPAKEAVPQNEGTPVKSFDILARQKQGEESAPVPQGKSSEAPSSAENPSMLEEKYKAYLSRVEKKPTVLIYDPNVGFVRRVVDPSDPMLTVTFAVEGATNSVVVKTFDTRGNELGSFKVPKTDLD